MIARLHYITQEIPGFTHAGLAEFACKGGVDWVQLRVKNKSFEEWLKIAEETKLVCKRYGATFIINDNVLIAKEVSADGVHLGKEDMSPKAARNLLGPGFIIGGSTNTIEDVSWMMEQGADYIGVGPYRFTSTKEKLNPVLGLEGIKNMVRQANIPAIAIGGIKNEDVTALLETGAHGVAVSSAINLVSDKTASAKAILYTIQLVNEKQLQK
jgi:thiamine-phosphate pyrophosphorylase